MEWFLFGSHFPLFYWESARLKLRASAFSPEQLDAIAHGRRVWRDVAER